MIGTYPPYSAVDSEKTFLDCKFPLESVLQFQKEARDPQMPG